MLNFIRCLSVSTSTANKYYRGPKIVRGGVEIMKIKAVECRRCGSIEMLDVQRVDESGDKRKGG
jgi:hypothetical protein